MNHEFSFEIWNAFIKKNYHRLRLETELANDNSLWARNRFAEMGKEVTPEEMKKFISLVSECLKLEEQQRLLNMVTKKITCTHCNQEYSFEVNKGDLEDWENGELIQDVLPYLSPGERELLMSGTCDSCWEKMFGDT